MSAGIKIPIGGDLAPFMAAISQVTAAIRQLSATIQSSMAPAQQVGRQAAAGMVNVATGASSAATGFKGFVGAASSAGMAIANIAAGAKGVRSAFNFLSSLPSGWKKVAAAAAGAGLAILGIVGAVRVVKSAFSSLLGAASSVWKSIKSGAASTASSVRSIFSGVASSVPGGSMLGPLAGIAGIAGGVALITTQLNGAFEAAAAFEDLEVRVSSFLGSTEAAAGLLKELSTFADKTPFATKDIQEAAGTLLGAGIRGDIAGITQDLAAVSRNGQQLNELADALGKGFSKGKFQTEELNKFLERGINLMPALRTETGLVGDALTKAIEKGLSFDQVNRALSSLSEEGGMFFGLLERRSKTASGLISTLSSAWNTLRRTFAQPIIDAIKPLLSGAIGLIESFKATAQAAGQAVADAMVGAFALVKSGNGMQLLTVGLTLAVASAMDLLMRGVQSAVAFLATALPPIFAGLTAVLQDPAFWQGVGLMFSAVGAQIEAAINSALGQTDLADSARRKADLQQKHGAMLISGAGGGASMGDILTKALVEGGMAAGKAFSEGSPSESLTNAREAMRKLLETVRSEIDAIKKSGAVPPPSTGATGQSVNAPLTLSAVKAAMIETTSLGKSGGGNFGVTFSPMLTEQRKGNNLLARIERNTQRLTGTSPAIV